MVRRVALSLLLTFSLTSHLEAQFSLFGRQQPVKSISAEELRLLQVKQASAEQKAAASGLAKPRPSFIIVDVRSSKEQAISVITGAITAQQFEKHRKHFANVTVVTYCTSGVRSERYARQLAADGQAVLNFKGSILEWCAAKYPLATLDGKSTQRVHTYSARNKVPSSYTAVY